MKRIIAILLCLTLVMFVGCSSKKDKTDGTENTKKTTYQLNPLTGEKISKGKLKSRPVAVMINNISVAQRVQTGINKADIVYETEVEGGITRLMAVFKDITAVNQLGTVRSARYAYVDLALGHDAIYAHCGQDPIFCAPHLSDIDDVSVETGKFGGTRISNGLSSEHTLYTYGDKLLEGIKAQNFRTTVKENKPWQKFAAVGKKVKLTDGECESVSVPFSTSVTSVFKYNKEKGKYTRYFGSEERKDYVTEETTDVKNVFVLLTTIRTYPTDPENKHREIDLSSGFGYYISNGAYAKINWSKGEANEPLKFTDENGKKLKVNAGKSWVCIADAGTSAPIFE